jgi:hypothetical protein
MVFQVSHCFSWAELTVKLQDAGATMATMVGTVRLDDLADPAPSWFGVDRGNGAPNVGELFEFALWQYRSWRGRR